VYPRIGGRRERADPKGLDPARSSRDAGIAYLLYEPCVLRYKDDPRFAALCRKVGPAVRGETSTCKSREPLST
jgi:hypothetical protein